MAEEISGEHVTPPIEEDFGDHTILDYPFEHEFGKMRKSMSMEDITALREHFVNLDIHQQSGAPPELSRTRFESMAEGCTKRPETFRSPKRSGLPVPQSKMKLLKPSHILSQQESEEIEREDITKKNIEANPTKFLIEGTSNLPEVLRKPLTVPEPFNLTEIQKRAVLSPDCNYKFKARPAPKHILEKPHIPVKSPVRLTKLSQILKHKRSISADRQRKDNLLLMIPQNIPKEQHHPRTGPLKPKPFSFEKRNEDLKRRREERIKRQIEAERKQANLFKAQPVPGAVKKHMQSTADKGGSSTTSSENKENFKFEAKLPVVLYKEPFKPVLQSRHLTKASPFKLELPKRAAERETFENLLKEKKVDQERERLLKEKEQEADRERENAEYRAKLIHRAKPAPKADSSPFLPKSSVALTVPETPPFVRRHKK